MKALTGIFLTFYRGQIEDIFKLSPPTHQNARPKIIKIMEKKSRLKSITSYYYIQPNFPILHSFPFLWE